MKRSLRTTRFSFAGSLFLGLMFTVLSSGPVGAVSDDEDRLFRYASHDKDNGTVRQLLAEGVSPNAPGNFDGRTAIHSAAKGGAAKNLAAMLQAGGKPNVQDRDGDTALHLASRGSFSGGFTDHAAAVRVLLQHGADVHRTNSSGETPLHVAVFAGVGSADVGVVSALLDAGARPSAVDGNGLTVLQRFARHGENNGAIVRLLLRAGANPDQKDPRGDAPLHAAIKSGGSYGKAEVVEALLDGGANPCVRNARGSTPYHMSSDLNRIHRALARAGGSDASHAGDSGCQMGSEDGPQMANKGEEGAGETGADPEPFGPNWTIAENQPCQTWHQQDAWNKLPDGNLNRGRIYTWSGDCVDGKVSGEGRGVWVLSDGRKQDYEGSMRDGKKHGYGNLTFENGNRYEGEWRDSEEHGQGTYTAADGFRYEGEWRDGKPHGHATLAWPDGDRYEGEYRDGKKHGHWVERFANGDIWEGPYVDGKRHGHWVERYADGDVWEGQFVDGKRKGIWVQP